MPFANHRLKSTLEAYARGATVFASNSRDRGHMARLHARFLELLQDGGPVLDLGCGPAHDAAELTIRGVPVVACDPVLPLLAGARGYPELAGRLVAADARTLPFRNSTFGGIWACASLLHLPRPDVATALSEAHRVLKAGGLLFTSMQEGPDDGAAVTGDDDSLPGRTYYFYRTEEWLHLVEAAGFAIMEQHLFRTSDHVAPGGTGWIETYARKP